MCPPSIARKETICYMLIILKPNVLSFNNLEVMKGSECYKFRAPHLSPPPRRKHHIDTLNPIPDRVGADHARKDEIHSTLMGQYIQLFITAIKDFLLTVSADLYCCQIFQMAISAAHCFPATYKYTIVVIIFKKAKDETSSIVIWQRLNKLECNEK